MVQSYGPADRESLGLTRALASYLRALVRPDQVTRDAISGSRMVVWLDDPALVNDAGGDVLVRAWLSEPELPPEPPESLGEWLDPLTGRDATGPPPALRSGTTSSTLDARPPLDVRRDFQRHCERWRTWAEAEVSRLRRDDLYRALADLEREAVQYKESHELVLAAGLLQAKTPGKAPVRRHLLATTVLVEPDAKSGELCVIRTGESRLRQEDRDFLDGGRGYTFNRDDPALAELDLVEEHPLSSAARAWLDAWTRMSWKGELDRQLDAWRAPPDGELDVGAASIAFAPALLLRRRERDALADFYERMIDDLDRPGAVVPLGMAQLVLPLERDDRLRWLAASGGSTLSKDSLFPLPANREQQDILQTLRQDTGVVVQGPPGTGKTHTIVNLVSALLADGQRVLVTSERAQALRVVWDKLPGELRDLCVFMSSSNREGLEEMDQSVTALSNLSMSNLVVIEGEVERLTSSRADAAKAWEQAYRDLLAVREQEYTVHPTVAPGYGGTPAQIVRAIGNARARHEWIEPAPRQLQAEPPITDNEAVHLLELLRTGTDDRTVRGAQVIPDLRSVPSSLKVAIASADVAAVERIFAPEPAAFAVFAALDHAGFVELERVVDGAVDALHAAGLSETLSDWNVGDWQLAAAEALLSRRSAEYWSRLFDDTDALAQHEHRLAELADYDVDLGTAGAHQIPRLLNQAKRLRRHLTGGGQLRRFRPAAAQRAAAELLEHCTVDGGAPTSTADLHAVVSALETEMAVAALADAWTQAGASISRGPVRNRIAQLRDVARGVAAVRALTAARDGIELLLRRAGTRFTVRSSRQWDLVTAVVRAGPDVVNAYAARRFLRHLVRTLDDAANDEHAAPEVRLLADAVHDRDSDRYRELRKQLERAAAQQQAQLQCDALLGRLSSAHPELADRVAATADDTEWPARLSGFSAAWSWARAVAYYRSVRHVDGEEAFERRVDETEQHLNRLTAELAAKQALAHCLRRMNDRQRQALQSFRMHMADHGQGHGKQRHLQLRAARSAMEKATKAIPAWVMPISTVAKTISPQPNTFDVVIVDEASQATVKALFLTWLAPRVIVVGDEKQCAPGNIEDTDSMQNLVNHHLDGLPFDERQAFKPTSNLYQLLSTRFPKVVRLAQHFRCMPEIIGWSSRQFYGGKLVPLRQFGADRLDPLRVVPVPDAVEYGTGENIRNEVEAAAIIGQVEKMVTDTDYDDRSICIIVLQGTSQITLLDKLLRERVEPQDIERHAIRVGSPKDFQGDERHVVLLSMVIAKTKRVTSGRAVQRLYNVAASRAKDQLWLFTSVDESVLKPKDLRRSLLSYMRQPPSSLTLNPRLDRATPDQLRLPFRTLFDQQIFLALRQRGYAAIPQYKVDDRAIDLLVVGDHGRLAVVCDTAATLTTLERIAEDLHWERGLRRADWQFVRIRDSEYALDAEAALEPLWRALNLRGIEPSSLPEAVPADTTWKPAVLSDDEDDTEGDVDA